MAKILITTLPMYGHVTPVYSIAKTLAKSEHEIYWVMNDDLSNKLSKHFSPNANFTLINNLKKIKHVPIDFDFHVIFKLRKVIRLAKKVFIDWPLRRNHKLIEDALLTYKPDLLITDCIFPYAISLAKKHKIPCMTIGVIPFPGDSKGLGPFGCGWQPTKINFIKASYYKILKLLIQKLVYDRVIDYSKLEYASRELITIFKIGQPLFDSIIENSDCYLQCSVPDFEYSGLKKFKNVEYCGFANYEFWDDIDQEKILTLAGGRPIAYITQGTVKNSDPQLLIVAIKVLINEDVFIVVNVPERIRRKYLDNYFSKNIYFIEETADSSVLEIASLFVTNGGFGGIKKAIAAGVPILCAGRSDDKGECGARVSHFGIGINLKTSTPTEQKFRNAIKKLLRSKNKYKEKALYLKSEINSSSFENKIGELVNKVLMKYRTDT